jgi:hypothetical protein
MSVKTISDMVSRTLSAERALTDRELQSLRNMSNECEEAADEIVRLRAAIVEALDQGEPTRSQKLADAGFARRPSLWAMEARQALELIATPMRPDGTWNRDRAACRQIAAEALGRHDEEKL